MRPLTSPAWPGPLPHRTCCPPLGWSWTTVDRRDGGVARPPRRGDPLHAGRLFHPYDAVVRPGPTGDRGSCTNLQLGVATAEWRDYTHVMKLDGDVELPQTYFSDLMSRFEADPELGIACGQLVERRGDRLERIPIPAHHVHGALKCYSRECFDAIGGVQDRLGWDTIDETYARMRGFRTRNFRTSSPPPSKAGKRRRDAPRSRPAWRVRVHRALRPPVGRLAVDQGRP